MIGCTTLLFGIRIPAVAELHTLCPMGSPVAVAAVVVGGAVVAAIVVGATA